MVAASLIGCPLKKYNAFYQQKKRFNDELLKIIPAVRNKLKPKESSSSSITAKSVRGINEELFEFEHKRLEKVLLKFNST